MRHIGPPSWMESFLRALLPERDRETVVGDFHEEFCHRSAACQGSVRASIWYLLQAVSFVPRRCRRGFIKPRMLVWLCAFTALCGCWLGVMDLRLRRPGYVEQAAIAATILLQALLTLGALRFRKSVLLRSLSMLGCLSLFWLAGKALIAAVRQADIEGYVLLIAVALLCQAVLTLCTLPKADASGSLV